MGSSAASASPIIAAHSPSSFTFPFHHFRRHGPHLRNPLHALQSPRMRPGPGLHRQGQQSLAQRRQQDHSRPQTRVGDMKEPSPSDRQAQSQVLVQPPIPVHPQQQQQQQQQPPPQPQSQPQLPSQSKIEPSPACSPKPHQPASDHVDADTRLSPPKTVRQKLSTSKLRALFASKRPSSNSSRSSAAGSERSRSSSPSPAATTEDTVVATAPEKSPTRPSPPKPAPAVAEPKIEPEPPRAQHPPPPAPSESTNASPSNKRRSSSHGDGGETRTSPTTLKKPRGEAAPPRAVPARYEQCPIEDLVVLIAHMISELIETNDALALTSGSLTRFHSRTAPGISVLDYLRRLARHATLTQPILLSMVYYIDRLCAMYPEFTINTLTVHRFLITAATVAAKGLLDSYWTNATYARVGGVRLAELKLLELEFLYRVDWRIIPNPEVLVAYYQGLIERHSAYVMEGEEEEDEESMFDESGSEMEAEGEAQAAAEGGASGGDGGKRDESMGVGDGENM